MLRKIFQQLNSKFKSNQDNSSQNSSDNIEELIAAPKPSISLDYDKATADTLKDHPLFIEVYDKCEQACLFYLQQGGPKSAIVMDIWDIVELHAETEYEIDIPLWTGIISVQMFPSHFAELAGVSTDSSSADQ